MQFYAFFGLISTILRSKILPNPYTLIVSPKVAHV